MNLNYSKQIEDEAVQIYPVPRGFQNSEISQRSETPDTTEDEDTKVKRSISQAQEDTDYLNELNKNLQSELEQRQLSRRNGSNCKNMIKKRLI